MSYTDMDFFYMERKITTFNEATVSVNICTFSTMQQEIALMNIQKCVVNYKVSCVMSCLYVIISKTYNLY